MAVDNWKDKSTFNCGTCMFYVEKRSESAAVMSGAPGGSISGAPAVTLGRCRRHAPRAEGGGWPAVYSSDWCGDHKLR